MNIICLLLLCWVGSSVVDWMLERYVARNDRSRSSER